MRIILSLIVLLCLSVHVYATVPVAKSSKAVPKSTYGSDSNFVGPWNELPVDSNAHLQRDFDADKKYVAAILRSPIDNGDPGLCDHKDLVNDKRELKRIAQRLEHRRASLNQQKSWIRDAQNGIVKIQDEMRHTRDTARNLAAQVDALQNQKQIILNHVRQQLLQKELDAASIHLVRLKKGSVEQRIKTENTLDTHALANAKANEVLKLIRDKRKESKSKKPRLQQVENESENSAEQETEQESEQTTEQENEQESEQ